MLLNEIKRATKGVHQGKVTILRPQDCKILKRECSVFLNSATKPIYRGFSQHPHSFMKVAIRKNRKPRDTDEFPTACFNVAIESLFGIKGIRNKSAFVSHDIGEVQEYGRAYYIFPTNKAKFLVGKGVYDSMSEFALGEWNEEMMNELGKGLSGTDWNRREEVTKRTPNNGNITLAQFKELTGKWYERIEKYIQKHLIKHMKGSNKYIALDQYSPAIKKYKREEILMHSAPHYYAIDVGIIEDHFNLNRETAFKKLVKAIQSGEGIKLIK